MNSAPYSLQNPATPCSPDLRRIVICGSVDDGKSTLIGRLLYDANLIYEDQLVTLAKESEKLGLIDSYDFSLLLDGLMAEREQKITIDVAYRYFSTSKSAFIIADAPGHTQYIRNMITAASTASVAVILVDALKGILNQTRRHSIIVSMLGIKNIICVVNKMDLVNYDQSRFNSLRDEYLSYVQKLGVMSIYFIPVSALHGDNILHNSSKTSWYKGQSLIQALESLKIHNDVSLQPFRMHVQWVNRPNPDFRGVSGQIASGLIMPGERITVLPSGEHATVDKIVTFDGNLDHAKAGQSITLTFTKPIDVSRGDVLSCVEQPCEVADMLKADVIWMAEKPMIVGRQYSFKIGTSYSLCTISKPVYVLDIDSLERAHASELTYNQVGNCSILLDRGVCFDLYENNHTLGSFIITDKITYEVLAAGIIREGSQRSVQIPLQALSVNQHMRSAIKWQKPLVLWFTGISGAGKSTIANLLEKKVHELGRHTMLLDANNLRHGLNKDLGFNDTDRVENTRRIAEVAHLMKEAGLITLVACIAPYQNERMFIRELIGKKCYVEIFVDVPLSVAEARDCRGLYSKARSGEIVEFTGISSEYERPKSPDIHLDTERLSPEQAVEIILDWLGSRFKIASF